MAALKHYFRTLSAGSAWGPAEHRRYNDLLTSGDRDVIFCTNLGSDDFSRLTAEDFLPSKICNSKWQANKLLNACHATGIINPTTGHPDTTKIDRHIVNKLAVIALAKQRMLIDLLFWWEEEIVRWRLLTDEETELSERLSTDYNLSDNERIHLSEMLQIVQAKKRVLPSLRDESGLSQHHAGGLPTYQARDRRAFSV